MSQHGFNSNSIKDEFNLDAIDKASRALGGIITKEIIKQCKLNG